jgi:two-component system chemotaxis response regulator CheY
MDVGLPDMSGVDAVRQIRALEEARGILSTDGAKILMATAADDPRDVVESFKALCDAYLVKPIDPPRLREELRKLGLIS